jgi:hypothetical protein
MKDYTINGLLHVALMDRIFDDSHHSLADAQYEQHASRGHYDHRPVGNVSRLKDWEGVFRN